MSLATVARFLLIACWVASAPAQAGVRLILPANTNLDNPRPKQLVEPDTLPRPNDIEVIPIPLPLPSLTPIPAPATTFHPARLENQLRSAFPSSAVRLGLVGDRLVLTGQAANAGEARAILDLVEAVSGGRPVVSRLVVQRQVRLHVLVAEVDRRAAASVGLPTRTGVGEQGRTAFALNALCSSQQATVLVAQTIPASEGKTAALSARRCQVTLCVAASSERVSLAVTARFSPADRCVLAQALQTTVELRANEALVLTSYSTENERDIILFVTPEIVDGAK